MDNNDIGTGSDLSFSYTLDKTPKVASVLLERYGADRVWLFDAPMGAGKTTLIKELCRELGVTEETSSPTFAIVNEYHNDLGEAIYHIDAYRLDSEEDLQNIGIQEYLDSGTYCFVEWPSLFGRFLPNDALVIRIDNNESGHRTLSVFPEGATLLYDPK